MHFVKRHALHVVRVFLLMTHLLFFLHSGIDWDLLQARPKNDCKYKKKKKIKRDLSLVGTVSFLV